MAELPVRKRIFYGMGGLTMNLPDLLVMQWLLVRYMPPDTPPLVPAALFGLFIMMGRLTDGIGCAIIAHWSDGCRSRWGRRMPFLYFGIAPFVFVFFMLFMPPVASTHWLNAVHAFFFIQCYFFLYGIVVTPYLALLPEVTSDLKERIDLTTSQSVFILVGTIVFAGIGGILQKWGWVAAIGGASSLMFLFFLPVLMAFREKPRATAVIHEPLSLIGSIKLALKNKPLRYVIASTTLYWFGLNATLALIPNWVIAFLGRSEGDVTKLMGPFLVVNLIFFFVFNAATRKFGKYVMLQISFIGSGVVIALLALVGSLPGNPFVQTAIVIALYGAPVAGFMVIPFAMLSDVIDYDEKLTGRRREAIFFGVQGIFQKAMIGISTLTFTVVPYLGADGYQTYGPAGLVISGVYSNAANPASGSLRERPEPGEIRIETTPDDIQAPWTLVGANGFRREGMGDTTIANLAPGRYRVKWGEVPGWDTPEAPRSPTPRGLKIMALLCGLSALAAFLVFMRYPIRDKDGKISIVG